MYLEQNNCVYKKIELESKHLTDYSLYCECHVEFPFKFSDKMVNKRDILKFINLYYLNDKKWMLYVLFYLMPCPFTGPKIFCAGPNILCQPKNLTAFSGG